MPHWRLPLYCCCAARLALAAGGEAVARGDGAGCLATGSLQGEARLGAACPEEQVEFAEEALVAAQRHELLHVQHERRRKAASLEEVLRKAGVEVFSSKLRPGFQRDMNIHAAAEVAGEGCHTITEADNESACYKDVTWAKSVGIQEHPEWYTGLDPATASLADWQFKVFKAPQHSCPRPCQYPRNTAICGEGKDPQIWPAPADGPSLEVKVLSYNVRWRTVFEEMEGNDNSTAKLIEANMHPQPFDFAAFQECKDIDEVLKPFGLAEKLTGMQGPHELCTAYRKDAWRKLDSGDVEVAEDLWTEFYGRRSVMWMRLQHKETGHTVFFLNHQGPLSVNTGGSCGGYSTAHNILQLIVDKAKSSDAVIVAGDFSANAASITLQMLWQSLVQVHNSPSFGGVDNILSNVHYSAVVSAKDLGSGGGDHHAISAVLQLGEGHESASVRSKIDLQTGIRKSLQALEGATDKFGCSFIPEADYTFTGIGWTHSIPDVANTLDCCTSCQQDERCKAFTWTDWAVDVSGTKCLLHSQRPTGNVVKDGSVAGLPLRTAIGAAYRAAYWAVK